MNRTILAIFLFMGFLGISASGSAQSLPDCQYTASDYDGDGWGWENDQSCQVTDSSEGMPTVTNQETGQPVDLIRPYWNAYRDFEGRKIQCDSYRWNSNTGNYVPHQAYRGVSKVAEFLPLSANAPWYGFIRTGDSLGAYPAYWTVNDGIFKSSTALHEFGLSDSLYVELIDDHGGAVRHWIDEASDLDTAFYECYGLDQQVFQPSGYMGEPRPAAQPVSETLVAVAVDHSGIDGIINRETNEPPELEAVSWDMTKLYNRELSCSTSRWMDITTWWRGSHDPMYGYTTETSAFHAEYGALESYVLFAPDYKTEATANSATGVVHKYEAAYDIYPSDGTSEAVWSVSNGEITEGPIKAFRYVEKISDDSYRFWKNSDEYTTCDLLPMGAVIIEGSNSPGGEESVNTDAEQTDMISTDDNTGNEQSDDMADNTNEVSDSGGGPLDNFLLLFLVAIVVARKLKLITSGQLR